MLFYRTKCSQYRIFDFILFNQADIQKFILTFYKMAKKIQGYTLLQCVGKGSSGEVFRAINSFKQGQFAVKVIQNQLLNENPKAEQCLLNQVKVLSKIGSCQNIVRFHQLIKTKNNHYFVYQFCNGGSLHDKLKKTKKLPESQALKHVKDILIAYKLLNKYKVLHRDLKPQNILFHNGKLKLADFGLCKDLKPEEHMTRTMIGSPIYMAPQILKGQSYTSKADIWSLGVILFQMLYGYCPYLSNSIASLVSKIEGSSLQFPEKPQISSSTKQIMKKMLMKDYFRRIGWVQLFKQFLNIEESDDAARKQSTQGDMFYKNSSKFISKNYLKGESTQKQKNWNKNNNNNNTISKKTSLCFIDYNSPTQLQNLTESKPVLEQVHSQQKQNKFVFNSSKYMNFLVKSQQKQKQKQKQKSKRLLNNSSNIDDYKYNSINLNNYSAPIYHKDYQISNNSSYNDSNYSNNNPNLQYNLSNFSQKSNTAIPKSSLKVLKIQSTSSNTNLDSINYNTNITTDNKAPKYQLPYSNSSNYLFSSPNSQYQLKPKLKPSHRELVYKLQLLHDQFVKISPYCQNLLRTKTKQNISDVLEFLLVIKAKLTAFGQQVESYGQAVRQGEHEDLVTMIKYEIIGIDSVVDAICMLNGDKNYRGLRLRDPNYKPNLYQIKSFSLQKTSQRISQLRI